MGICQGNLEYGIKLFAGLGSRVGLLLLQCAMCMILNFVKST